jgi:cytochrome d ubiquinol oxidase subunit II
VPIDASKHYTGTLFTLLNPHAILGGLVSLLVFTLHGAVFLTLRTEGLMRVRAARAAVSMWWPTALVTLLFAAWGYAYTDVLGRYGMVPGTLPLVTIAAFVGSHVLLRFGREGWAFAMTAVTIVAGSAVAFSGLFPRVLPSTLRPEWDLTIYNAASSQLTLTVMLVVVVAFLPGVLAYQAWSYWVFRERVAPRRRAA